MRGCGESRSVSAILLLSVVAPAFAAVGAVANARCADAGCAGIRVEG